MTIVKAIELIKAHNQDPYSGPLASSYYYRGQYHDNAQAVTLELLESVDVEKYPTMQDLLADDDNEGLTNTYAESNTLIYNHDRAEWFATNWAAVDDYLSEMGLANNGDIAIMDIIGAAYCYTLENEIRECLQKLADDIESA